MPLLHTIFLGFWFYEATLQKEIFGLNENGNIHCFQQFFMYSKYTATQAPYISWKVMQQLSDLLKPVFQADALG